MDSFEIVRFCFVPTRTFGRLFTFGDARQKFIAESAYLDDRPGVPMRFLAEANLTQIIRRQEQHVDPSESRAQLNDLIKDIFKEMAFAARFNPISRYKIRKTRGCYSALVTDSRFMLAH